VSQIILYTTEDGYLAEVIPASDCDLTIEEIAAKDVPAGITYHIVNTSELPTDRTFRDAWEWV
jgi:hypothetical protein